MKRIKLCEYNSSYGPLIDVRHPIDYAKWHDKRSKNIYINLLLSNPSKFLDKTKTYYIMCEKGVLSGRVVNILTYMGYNAIQVIV